jgi:class 3 adenylate cyclase/tetratricopeptide (TPR) repeat protein
MMETANMTMPAEKPDYGNIAGERKTISVLFTDLVNYTTLTEKLDMEVLRDIMDQHFKSLMESVKKYKGTVDQLLGDGMVAFFGAPLAHEDHAQRACYAALDMQSTAKEFATKLLSEYGVDFSIRIGINSGPVVIGPVGDDQHTEYIATGNTVNLASRMEEASRPGGILVTEAVYSLTRDFFDYEPIGEIGIKGKDAPVAAYRLLRSGKTQSRFGAALTRGLTPFVGREREIQQLRQAFDESKEGKNQTIGIKGEPGIGKTRLIKEFQARIKPDEPLFLEGHCLHYGSLIPYRPIIDILKTLFGIREDDPEPAAKGRMQKIIEQLDGSLLSCLPFFYEIFSYKVDDDLFFRMENQYRRNRLFEGITQLIIKESARKPVVIALEDLHWIDKASEDFLSYLEKRLSGQRILVLLLYRLEYQSPWLDRIDFNEIQLNQLSASTSDALLQTLLPEGRPAAELKDLISNRTAGNPLFVEEFVRTLLENGSIRKTGDRYILDSSSATITLPDTIQGIIAARVDRLPEKLRNILQVASVAGRNFNRAVLQDVLKIPDQFKGELEALQRLEFILRQEGAQEMEFVFKHALIHEVVYHSLLQKRRQELHRRIGNSIEKLYAESLEDLAEVLAYHFQHSGDTEKAIKYLRKSGQRALDRFAVEQSHQYYQQAFRTLSDKADKTTEDRPILLDIVLAWSEVYYYRGYFRELLELLNEHISLAEDLGDKPRQAMLLGWLGNMLFISARNKEAHQYLQKAFNLAEESGDQKALAHVCAWLVWTCVTAGLIDQGIDYGEKALKAAGQIREAYPYIKTLGGLGVLLNLNGKINKAVECSEELKEFGRTHGNIRGLALGYYVSGMCCVSTGDTMKALNEYNEGLELNVDPIYYGMLRSGLASALCQIGRFKEAEPVFAEMIELCHKFGGEIVGEPCSAFLGMVLISQGQMQKGFHMLDKFEVVSGQEYLNYLAMWNEYGHGWLYASLASVDSINIPMLLKNAGTLIKRVPFATQKAILHFEKCAEVCRRSGYITYLGITYLELGRFCLKQGKGEMARTHLASAVKIFREIGAGANLKQAEELLQTLEKSRRKA